MGTDYGQLRLEERIEIYRLHAEGESRRHIARALGRAPSTISRELARNSVATKVHPGGYEPVRAQRLAERRRRWDARFKLARQPDLRALVWSRLAMGCSPEQVAGRLARENGGPVISHESIYRFAYHRSAQKDYWHRLLPRRHKARRGRAGRARCGPTRFIAFRRPIGDRSAAAGDRSTPGHWEADFMLFAKPGQGLLVLHERHTRFTIVDRPPHRKAELTAARIARALKATPAPLRHTISFDNGAEFSCHHRLHKTLGVETFFCDPHSPWQKGGVENAIGRLRRSLPRKTDLAALSPRQLSQHLKRLNDIPRKCLGFKTPAEAFSELKSNVALQT